MVQAQRLKIELSLYTGDAVHLATAIHTSSKIFWMDDKHFTKPEIIKMAKENGVEIKYLHELDESYASYSEEGDQ